MDFRFLVEQDSDDGFNVTLLQTGNEENLSNFEDPGGKNPSCTNPYSDGFSGAQYYKDLSYHLEPWVRTPKTIPSPRSGRTWSDDLKRWGIIGTPFPRSLMNNGSMCYEPLCTLRTFSLGPREYTLS
ncbi:hypothetical protein L210DRAFT_3500694 [Boletus edulis BED1]|uniref:Uncharacterized protein n=1 Tax=Boletus edulis BED1 TaxID=1328754 RepID=A0AAD4C4Z2_BOLED|nr:hypothetical protein L210DRAFT_3500694 [Boletus edulis BED1]